MSSTISEHLDPRIDDACTFTTRQVHDPSDFVRTRGVVLRTTRGIERCLTGGLIGVGGDAQVAWGKVAVLHEELGTVGVRAYQRSDAGTEARQVACSNATAAAIAVRATAGAVADTGTFALALPDGQQVRVDWVASALAPTELTVDQTWCDVQIDVRDIGIVDGRRLAVCQGPLNDYLIVAARPGESVDGFTVADARSLWAQFGFLRTPLGARLAFVAGDAPVPRAAFFTCGAREHPSAPLTGLAVLAVARARLEWPGLVGITAVETRLGPFALPHVSDAGDRASTFEFPTVVVHLHDA